MWDTVEEGSNEVHVVRPEGRNHTRDTASEGPGVSGPVLGRPPTGSHGWAIRHSFPGLRTHQVSQVRTGDSRWDPDPCPTPHRRPLPSGHEVSLNEVEGTSISTSPLPSPGTGPTPLTRFLWPGPPLLGKTRRSVWGPGWTPEDR